MGQVAAKPTRGQSGTKESPTPRKTSSPTLYHVLGIDPALTFPDFQGRPIHLLDDRETIRELV